MTTKRKNPVAKREDEEKKKQLKAKLLKIKLAAVRPPATPEARRGLIQDTKNPSATVEGSNTQTQNRLRAEGQFINKNKKIRPKGPNAKISPSFKKRLAKLNQQKTASEHGHTILMKGHERGVYRAAGLTEQQGHYAKYWLLNAKETNGNGWGIAAHSAKENMSKFIGRPLVVTSSVWHGASQYGTKYDHPYVPTNDLNKIFEHQEQYRVGNIVDVGEKNGDYYAMIEMLPKFANMTLPPFCSPAIYQLDAKEAEGQISKWEALHLAALDENPAYGSRIALLRGVCVGTNNECRVQFKSAKQKETNITCTNGVKTKISKLKLRLAATGLSDNFGKDPIRKTPKTDKLVDKITDIAMKQRRDTIIHSPRHGAPDRMRGDPSTPLIKEVPFGPDTRAIESLEHGNPKNFDHMIGGIDEFKKQQKLKQFPEYGDVTGKGKKLVRDVTGKEVDANSFRVIPHGGISIPEGQERKVRPLEKRNYDFGKLKSRSKRTQQRGDDSLGIAKDLLLVEGKSKFVNKRTRKIRPNKPVRSDFTSIITAKLKLASIGKQNKINKTDGK